MRPTLFRLASETVDDDSALAQILEANDKLTLVVNAFKEQAGSKSGRERSQSQEETAVKSDGKVVPHTHALTSWSVPLCSAFADPVSSCSRSSEEPQRD